MYLNPQVIKQQIENLKLIYPEVVNGEDWPLILDTETDLHELLKQIVHRIDDTEALVIGTKHRLEDLKARKERFEHRIEVLRELAFKVMHAADIAKVELPEATLSLRAGTQQLVGDADPTTLADEFCKISRALDRTAIKDALKTGQTVPGFSLSNAQPSLSIRIK